MKRLTAFIAMAALACGIASPATPEKPRPEEYTLTVHVVASRVNVYVQVLEADVEGRRVELARSFDITGHGPGVLAPGDYKAKADAKAAGSPKQMNGYDLHLGYQLLLPDGTTRGYGVIAICTAEARSCTHP